MFTFSNAPLDDDDKDMEMFYFMTALDARLCSVKKESCCSTSQLVTTRISAFIYCFMKCGAIMAQYTLNFYHYDFVSAELVH